MDGVKTLCARTIDNFLLMINPLSLKARNYISKSFSGTFKPHSAPKQIPVITVKKIECIFTSRTMVTMEFSIVILLFNHPYSRLRTKQKVFPCWMSFIYFIVTCHQSSLFFNGVVQCIAVLLRFCTHICK